MEAQGLRGRGRAVPRDRLPRGPRPGRRDAGAHQPVRPGAPRADVAAGARHRPVGGPGAPRRAGRLALARHRIRRRDRHLAARRRPEDRRGRRRGADVRDRRAPHGSRRRREVAPARHAAPPHRARRRAARHRGIRRRTSRARRRARPRRVHRVAAGAAHDRLARARDPRRAPTRGRRLLVRVLPALGGRATPEGRHLEERHVPHRREARSTASPRWASTSSTCRRSTRSA